MEQILDLPSTSQRTMHYAGFWIRFAAALIDGILLGFVNFLVLSVIGFNAFGSPADFDPNTFVIAYLFQFVTYVLYHTLMESSAKQATLGKMAVGIKVGKENGERLSFANALGRYFSKFISALILLIGYLMAAWDAKKQALHDKIAGTYVFYGK